MYFTSETGFLIFSRDALFGKKIIAMHLLSDLETQFRTVQSDGNNKNDTTIVVTNRDFIYELKEYIKHFLHSLHDKIYSYHEKSCNLYGVIYIIICTLKFNYRHVLGGGGI